MRAHGERIKVGPTYAISLHTMMKWQAGVAEYEEDGRMMTTVIEMAKPIADFAKQIIAASMTDEEGSMIMRMAEMGATIVGHP